MQFHVSWLKGLWRGAHYLIHESVGLCFIYQTVAVTHPLIHLFYFYLYHPHDVSNFDNWGGNSARRNSYRTLDLKLKPGRKMET